MNVSDMFGNSVHLPRAVYGQADPVQVVLRDVLNKLGDNQLVSLEADVTMLTAHGIMSSALEQLVTLSLQLLDVPQADQRLAA